MTIKLTISARELDPKVNYIPFKGNSQNFTKEKIEEVMKENLSKPNKLAIYGSTLGVSQIPGLAHAETSIHPEISALDPQIVFEFSLKIATMGLGLSVGFTALLLILSSMMKQIGGKERRDKSKEWTTDIIKGFVQCLVAIPTVFALYYLAVTIFGNLDFTSNTFLNLP